MAPTYNSVLEALGQLDFGKLAGYAPPPPPDYQAPPPPPPPPPVARRRRRWQDDPTYMAFLRQMGLDESMVSETLEGIILAGAQAAKRDATFFEDQRMIQEKSINEGAEERGMFRSGRRVRDVARAKSEIDLQETEGIEDRASQLAQAQMTAANERTQIEIDRQEAELAARDRAARQNA
tara:strand:+ start:13994 stop:14530 length:537 start_codon:yes stop_codon:yes gene_type:complete